MSACVSLSVDRRPCRRQGWTLKRHRALIACALCLSMFDHAYAQLGADGVVLIDQPAAEAGGVTPGDDPGFPVTLSRPGSYRLSGNLRLTNPTTNGIEITAASVTVDLNGFVIEGPADVCRLNLRPTWCGQLGTGIGISAVSTSDTTIVNGTVRAIAGKGLWLGRGARVEGLVITDNREFGVAAADLFISKSRISRNGLRAQVAAVACQICIVMDNLLEWNGVFGNWSRAIEASYSVDYGNNVLRGNHGVSAGPGGVRAVAPNLCDNLLCQ